MSGILYYQRRKEAKDLINIIISRIEYISSWGDDSKRLTCGFDYILPGVVGDSVSLLRSREEELLERDHHELFPSIGIGIGMDSYVAATILLLLLLLFIMRIIIIIDWFDSYTLP